MKIVFTLLTFLFLLNGFGGEKPAFKNQIDNGLKCLENEQIDSAEFFFKNAIVLSQNKDTLLRSEILFVIGLHYESHFHHKEALIYLEEATRLSANLDDPLLKMDLSNQIGVTNYNLRNFSEALKQYKYGLELAFQVDDTIQIAYSYNNIGLIFLDTKDFIKAIEYFEKVIKTIKEDNSLLSIVYNNLGIALYQTKEYHKALASLNLSQEYALKTDERAMLGNSFMNKGLCYIDLNEFEKAQLSLEKALGYYTKKNDYQGELLSKVNLSKTNFKLNRIEKAKQLETEITENLILIENQDLITDFYTYMIECYLDLGDSAVALDYSLKLIDHSKIILESLEDNTLNKLKNDISFTSVTGELNKVQDEKQEIETINTKLKSSNKLIIVLSSGLILVGLFFVIYMIKSVNKTRKINNALKKNKVELTEKNKEILNSISYANSMEKLLLQQMNPHFLFNALTTLEASIRLGDTKFANEYISMFSSLLRKTLDYSMLESISLLDEIDFLESYIKLNATKQGSSFHYAVSYDYEQVADFVNTPPMLVQPFVENALIHGLYHKTDGSKQLDIHIEPHDEFILWTITDNGVGRKKSEEINRTHKGISHGIKITRDRINWMEKIYGNHFSIEYHDLEEGTKVVLKTPIIEV
ncbi:MAG: two-component system LytT family sensor kinase [Crocinitomix sp.]|jgi:two-component system LytT family sensor kinase